jgi:hypothetical protein
MATDKRPTEASLSFDSLPLKRQRLDCSVSTDTSNLNPSSPAEAGILSTPSTPKANNNTPDPSSPQSSTVNGPHPGPESTSKLSTIPNGSSRTRAKPKPIVGRIVTTESPNPVEGEYIVQDVNCQSYQKKQKDFPMCMACIRRQFTSGGCKFTSLRAFPAKKKVIQSYTPMFIDSAPFLGKKQREANRSTSVQYSTRGDGDDVHFMRDCITPTFSSILATELEFETVHKDRLVRRLREAGVRPICDGCATTIFSGHFMCCACGKEVCVDCYAQWDDTLEYAWGDVDCCSRKRRHTKRQMVPFTYFQPGELEKLIVDVMRHRQGQNPAEEGKEFSKFGEKGYLPYTKAAVDEVAEADFQRLWELGEPIVLTGCLPRFQIPWTPEHFMEQYGEDTCMLINCNSDKTINTTVGKFFSEFFSHEPKRPLKLKVPIHLPSGIYNLRGRIGHPPTISQRSFQNYSTISKMRYPLHDTPDERAS